MAGYYYQQLNKAKKRAYDVMRDGIDSLIVSIRIPLLSAEEIAEVFQKLKLDEPLLFFAVSYHFQFYPGAEHVDFLPEYLFGAKKIKEHRKAVETRIERITAPLKSLPAEERELKIHDFILDNVRYDKLKKPYSHEILGPLTQGVGVCEGIAKTVKVLCDAVSIPCIVALSEANPEKGMRYRHAWNVVMLRNQYYHLDATFDNTLRHGIRRYDYFNLSDKALFSDHQQLVYPVPPCTDDKLFYYSKMSLTKLENVENRFSQALRKKQEHFVFHWRGGGLNQTIVTEIFRCCADAAAKRDKKISCSLNIRQAVFQFDVGDTEKVEIENPMDVEKE